MMTDPIAEMLTRIRNANFIYRPQVDIPYSKIKEGLAKKLKQEGFIKDYKKMDNPPQGTLTVYLKYGPEGEHVIREIQRVSKPGRRVYKKVENLEKILNGAGIAILSTPQGVLTDHECRTQNVGGEVLCNIW
jgi:small subunit ribosomal protein S8